MKTKLRFPHSQQRIEQLCIPAIAAEQVLKVLHENNIPAKFQWPAPSGKLLMQIRYKEDQQGLINELEEFMKLCEVFVQELGQALTQAIQQKYANRDANQNAEAKQHQPEKKQSQVTATA